MEGPPILGMGCMRLSTDRERDPDRAVALLHEAFDAGVTFVDTADAYCWDAAETGHNERLIAAALHTWSGDRSRIQIATKGGLTRPGGNWIPDGRARHLVAACESSRQALGLDRISLYQLHTVDPRTPLGTSIRALDTLKRDGLIEAIGLCNVTVGQIAEAREIADIASVQVELSLWCDDNLMNGVVEYCLESGIRVIAYRPFGGAARRGRVLRDKVLGEIAARHAATPFEIALSWLFHLSPLVVPLPGPTRTGHARSIGRAAALRLTSEDRGQLDEAFPSGHAVRFRDAVKLQPAPPLSPEREVLLIMGIPGAGKSTLAASFAGQGYERLNRDAAGGRLKTLLPALDRLISAGSTRVVLDNTYVSRKSRAAVIRAARLRGFGVRCVALQTSIEDAQVNAASRLVAKYGRLLGPDEIRAAAKRDPNVFAPSVQFRYQREIEWPRTEEGFSRVDFQSFERKRNPSFNNRALIVWMDGVLIHSRSGKRTPVSVDDVEIAPERLERLRRFHGEGWILAGLSWQPEIAGKQVTPGDIQAVFDRFRQLVHVPIDIQYCPHGAGPASCWCRKPLPGLGVLLVHRHQLDPAQSLYVGSGVQDPGFARRLGFHYREADEFFGGDGDDGSIEPQFGQ